MGQFGGIHALGNDPDDLATADENAIGLRAGADKELANALSIDEAVAKIREILFPDGTWSLSRQQASSE